MQKIKLEVGQTVNYQNVMLHIHSDFITVKKENEEDVFILMPYESIFLNIWHNGTIIACSNTSHASLYIPSCQNFKITDNKKEWYDIDIDI